MWTLDVFMWFLYFFLCLSFESNGSTLRIRYDVSTECAHNIYDIVLQKERFELFYSENCILQTFFHFFSFSFSFSKSFKLFCRFTKWSSFSFFRLYRDFDKWSSTFCNTLSQASFYPLCKNSSRYIMWVLLWIDSIQFSAKRKFLYNSSLFGMKTNSSQAMNKIYLNKWSFRGFNLPSNRICNAFECHSKEWY